MTAPPWHSQAQCWGYCYTHFFQNTLYVNKTNYLLQQRSPICSLASPAKHELGLELEQYGYPIFC